MNKKIIFGSLFLLILAGCIEEGKVTGGGWIVSSDGQGKANYGFNGSSCGGDVKGHFTYNDKSAGMKVLGDVTGAGLCVDDPNADFNQNCVSVCSAGDYLLEFTYDSTAKDAPGSGDGVACMTDGATTGASDEVLVLINTGPYAGYMNDQETSGGNINAHDCPGSKGKGKKS